ELASPHPAANETFRSLATKLAQPLPRSPGTRAELAETVRARDLTIDPREFRRESSGSMEITHWRLVLDRAWTVPAVRFAPAGARETVLLVNDNGRKAATAEISAHIEQRRRVVVVDPFYVGESKIGRRDYLFAILIASLGERPLGLEASQLTA